MLFFIWNKSWGFFDVRRCSHVHLRNVLPHLTFPCTFPYSVITYLGSVHCKMSVLRNVQIYKTRTITSIHVWCHYTIVKDSRKKWNPTMGIVFECLQIGGTNCKKTFELNFRFDLMVVVLRNHTTVIWNFHATIKLMVEFLMCTIGLV